MKQFLSCDWGTSAFRLRVLNAAGEIIEEIKSDDGISAVHQDWMRNKGNESKIQLYRKRLGNVLKELKTMIEPDSPIIISGMASSSIGIIEMPYRPLPFVLDTDLPAWQLMERDKQFQHPVYIVSGFSTRSDVMRGEETMLLGIGNVSEDEICILPGTHSKHAYLKSGVLTDFKTYVTGELFNVMAQFSILSNSMIKGEDTSAFEAGLDEAASGNLLNQFFKVRTRQILDKTSGVSNYQFLSGLLIGTELKELRNTSSKIRLISEGVMAELYTQALKQLNFSITVTSASEALIKGHLRVLKRVLKT